jgi:DUF4097 and DUF4098 domain-containing protein YvlB
VGELVRLFSSMGKPVVQENTVRVKHIQELVIHSDVTNIEFIIHDKKRAHFILETFEKGPTLDVNLTNDRLEINVELRKKKRFFQIRGDYGKLMIYLPKDFAENYFIQTTVGNIRFADVHFNDADLHTGAGDIKVNQVEGGYVRVESGAGNIKIEDVNVIEFVARSGAGNIRGRNCSGKLAIQSGAGNIHFTLDGEDDVSMKSGAGNIDVYFRNPSMLDGKLQTGTGIGTVNNYLMSEDDTSRDASMIFGEGERQYLFKTGVGNVNLYEQREAE